MGRRAGHLLATHLEVLQLDDALVTKEAPAAVDLHRHQTDVVLRARRQELVLARYGVTGEVHRKHENVDRAALDHPERRDDVVTAEPDESGFPLLDERLRQFEQTAGGRSRLVVLRRVAVVNEQDVDVVGPHPFEVVVEEVGADLRIARHGVLAVAHRRTEVGGDADVLAASAERRPHVVPKLRLCPEHVDVVDPPADRLVDDADGVVPRKTEKKLRAEADLRDGEPRPAERAMVQRVPPRVVRGSRPLKGVADVTSAGRVAATPPAPQQDRNGSPKHRAHQAPASLFGSESR